MQKNDEVVLTIEDFGFQGEGIARSGGLTVFVPYAIIGEKVRVRILQVNKTIAFAKVEEILTPADERVRPACPVFGKCGGCQLQHLRYSNQLRLKSDLVARSFRKYAHLDLEVPQTVKSDHAFGYRNKLQIPVGRKNGKNVIGFYAPNSHRIVETDHCLLQPVWTKRVIETMSAFLERYGLRGYDEESGTGEIRHVVVREVFGKLLITVVINGQDFRYRRELAEIFSREFERCGVFLNFNDQRTNVILGDRFEHLCGIRTAEGSSHRMKYRIHPASFYQVNDYIREKIYSKVLSLVMQTECDAVVDAYAGAGILTAILTRSDRPCYGIELVPEATEDADSVCRMNGLEGKMYNRNGDCATELPRLVSALER